MYVGYARTHRTGSSCVHTYMPVFKWQKPSAPTHFHRQRSAVGALMWVNMDRWRHLLLLTHSEQPSQRAKTNDEWLWLYVLPQWSVLATRRRIAAAAVAATRQTHEFITVHVLSMGKAHHTSFWNACQMYQCHYHLWFSVVSGNHGVYILWRASTNSICHCVGWLERPSTIFNDVGCSREGERWPQTPHVFEWVERGTHLAFYRPILL